MSKILGERGLRGAITISRPSGVRDPHISISIHDRRSGTEFLEVAIALDDFARALTGLGWTDCEFVLSPTKVGLVREVKRLQVAVPDGEHATREQRAAAAVAEHDVDGWVGSTRDALNHHNRVHSGDDGNGGYTVHTVSYVRFVDPPSDYQDAADD